MPRTALKVETFYQFDELSDSAKENARSWWREAEVRDFDPEYEDFCTCAEILGIDLANRSVPLMNGKTRNEPNIRYSGFWSQGDGASWAGHYNYAKDSPEKIREHAPQDEELHRIADALHALQAKHLWLLIAQISFGHYGGSYVHSGTMVVDTDRMEDATGMLPDLDDPSPLTQANWDRDTEELKTLMRDFADWIYRQLNADYDWRMTDENVDECITCNNYEFTEEGHIS